MTIEITWPHLQQLAVNGAVKIGEITLTVQRPVRSHLNCGSENQGDEFVTFSLDASDPRFEPLKFTPKD
jgi:hypothetical protein